MLVSISNDNQIKNLFKKFTFPKSDSHKGENGKILIIGGSSLFHAASLWAAELASHFADMVHYSSTKENEKIFLKLKTIFRNGIIVSKKDLESYIKEDDVVLVGPGMIRNKIKNLKIDPLNRRVKVKNWQEIFNLKDEGEYTRELVYFLIDNFPEKKFVFDAGALQMMDKEWLLKLKTPSIITPHQKEFERLFGIDILNKDFQEKEKIVQETAKRYQTVILLKAVKDIISDGKEVFIVEGGNAGLTKGGTGDVLASLTACFYVKNKPLYSAIFSSILLKKTSESLFQDKGYWYNVSDIINTLPKVLKKIIL